MINELKEIDKKVLTRISHELCKKNQRFFPEFPELSEKDIKNSIKNLEKLGLIKFDDEIKVYISSQYGDKYIEEHNLEFKQIIKVMNKNLFNEVRNE